MTKLTQEQIEAIGLPKWPQLVVYGEPVTLDQAAEILIRTSGMFFCSNDRDFDIMLLRALGIHAQSRHDPGVYEQLTNQEEKYQCLPLSYLTNSRIVSSFIGGPHGWCDWEGSIGCYGYNIGKWPSAACVLEEWRLIATEWPFLNLRSQLYDREHCDDCTEGEPLPVIEYHVAGGKVTAHAPEAPLPRRHSGVSATGEAAIMAIMMNPLRERGCDIRQFERALEITRRALDKRASP